MKQSNAVWLEELPEEIKQKALANIEQQGLQTNLKGVSSNMGAAIAGMFLWDKSNEGFKFWNDYAAVLSEAERSGT